MELLVMSQADAVCYKPGEGEVCISITTDADQTVALSKDFAEVLRLAFAPADYDRMKMAMNCGMTVFAVQAARVILEFVARHANARRVVIHCSEAESRSPGVLIGLLDAAGLPTTDASARFPKYNRMVAERLADVARRLDWTAPPMQWDAPARASAPRPR